MLQLRTAWEPAAPLAVEVLGPDVAAGAGSEVAIVALKRPADLRPGDAKYRAHVELAVAVTAPVYVHSFRLMAAARRVQVKVDGCYHAVKCSAADMGAGLWDLVVEFVAPVPVSDNVAVAFVGAGVSALDTFQIGSPVWVELATPVPTTPVPTTSRQGQSMAAVATMAQMMGLGGTREPGGSGSPEGPPSGARQPPSSGGGHGDRSGAASTLDDLLKAHAAAMEARMAAMLRESEARILKGVEALLAQAHVGDKEP